MIARTPTPAPVKIALSPSEVLLAANIGVFRAVDALARNARPAYGADPTVRAWDMHIEGACGECALAKYLGVYWGRGAIGAPDVGQKDDVRTRSKDSWDLIVHPRDSDERFFWLLTGGRGNYRIWGFIPGREAKKREFWADPAGGRPAYFVPKSALYPPQTRSEYAADV